MDLDLSAMDAASLPRDRFVEIIAQELRAPLAIVRGWADVILSEVSNNPNIEAAGHGLLEAVGQMSRALSDLADPSTIALGAIRLRHETVPLHDLIPKVLGAFGASHVVTVIEEPAFAHGDPERIAQILVSLVETVVSHSDGTADLTVTLRRRGAWARIHIETDGPDLPMRAVRPLLTPLDIEEPGEPNLELSLSYARALALAHGGHIGVDGDVGISRFWVHLPAHTPPGSSAEPADVSSN